MANEVSTRFSNTNIEATIQEVQKLKRVYESVIDEKKIAFQVPSFGSAIRDIKNYNRAVESIKSPSSKTFERSDVGMQKTLADIKRYQTTVFLYSLQN